MQQKQTPQKARFGKPDAAGVPMQAKLPPACGGAPVRISYQPSPAPQSGGVVQCFGFGKLLKKLFCCCTRDREIPERRDGPCAVAAMRNLGWEADYRDMGIKLQSAEFGAVGTVLNTNAAFQALASVPPVMLLFLRPGEPVPFHVMYIENGDLCGVNNDCDILRDKFGMSLIAAADRREHDLARGDEQVLGGVLKVAVNTLHFNDLVPPEVKFVTRNDYFVFRQDHGLQPENDG